MRRPFILLLVLVALAPTTAMASDWFRCRTDGETRSTCCCPQEEEEERVPGAPPEVDRASCCDIGVTEARASDLRFWSDAVSASALVAVIPQEMTGVSPVQAPAKQIDRGATPAKPRGPPDLFLRNCSFLL